MSEGKGGQYYRTTFHDSRVRLKTDNSGDEGSWGGREGGGRERDIEHYQVMDRRGKIVGHASHK